MSTQALTIRIGADASGAISVLSQATTAVNNLGNAGNNANRGVASLTGGVQNLGRYSANSTSATASLTGGVSGLSRATLDAVHNTSRLNQSLAENTRVTNAATGSLLSFANAAKLAVSSLAGFAFSKAISEIATFETKLLSLKALTMANTEQMKQMETQARQLGATTAFSAQQAAEAQGVLASTGLKVNEILKATPQVLALAAAGNLDLAKAAEISMATMKGLGLQLQDLGHINDVFAKVAADSAINVEQVGVAMGEAAPSMRAFGVSLETTAAAIGILKDNGIKVGSIGDGLKSMMGALANETKENTKILEKHNLTYKDLNVETLGLTKVLNNLKGANLTAAESIKVLGLDAFNVTKILINNTQALENNGNSLVKTSGDAQTQADILNQGLAKAWDALKGSLSEAALQMGETKASADTLAGGLTNLIQTVTGVISIYEGMGDQFAKANKLTAEQYGHLKDVANQINVVAGAAAGIGLLTAALWSANKAAVVFKGTLALISRHPIMAIAGAGAALYGANKAALSNAMAETDSQIAYYENRVNKYKDKSVLLRPIDFDLKKESAALLALKQAKQEKADFEKNQAAHSESIKGIVNETEQWYALTDSVKSSTGAIATHGEGVEKASKAHKGLTDAQRELKKQQDEYNHLLEKFKGEDPFEKYAKSMAELNRVQKDLSPETFLLNQKRIADEFEKNTVDLNAYNKELERHKKLIDNVGDYNATISELQNSLATKEISKEKFSVGVTAANAKLMNDVTGTNIPATAVGEHQAAIAAEKLADKSKQITKAYENEWEALQKIRREITLNSDAEYEAHIRKQGFSEERIDMLKAEHEEIKKLKLLDDIGLSVRGLAQSFSSMFSQVLTQGKSFTDALRGMFKGMISKISDGLMNFGMNAMMSGNFLAGAASMAGSVGVGLLSSLFKDKTIDTRLADSKTDGTVLGGGSSNSIQNIVKTLNDIHAKEYKELKGINDNFMLLSRGVDNTVQRAVALHGSFVPSTNGMKTTYNGANEKQFLMGLGTTAVSAGLAAAGVGTSLATTALASMISTSVAVTGGASAVTGALVSTSAALMSGGLAAAAAMGGIGLLVGGAIYGLSKLLGIGKTKYYAIGNGIVTNAIQYTAEGAQQALVAYDYSTIKAVTKGWFSNKTKIYDVINGINNQMSEAFGQLFGQLGKTLYDSFASMGISDLVQKSYVLPALKIDLTKSKTDQEISDTITKAINTMSDMVATELVGGLFGRFQKMGEGMLQTIGRVAIEMGGVEIGFRKIGVGLKLTGMAGVEFSQSLVSMYESMPNANDGLKNFTASINEFYNAVLTAGQKTAFSLAGWENFAKEFNATYTDKSSKNYVEGAPTLNADPFSVRGTDITAALNITKKIAETTSESLGALTSHSQDIENATNPMTTNNLASYKTKSAAHASFFSDSIVKGGDYTNATWADIPDNWEKAIQLWANNPKVDMEFFKEIVRVVDANTAKQKDAVEKISVAGINLDTIDADIAAKSDAVKVVQSANKAIIDSGGLFDSLKAFKEQVSSLSDSYVKATSETNSLTKAREREIEKLKQIDTTQLDDGSIVEKIRDISTLTDDITGKPLLSDKTKADFFAWQNLTQGAGADLKITTAEFQQFVWSIEDAEKAVKKLTESNKYIKDFGTSIKDWVNNLKATSLGSTKSQLDAAALQFESKMRVINNDFLSAEQKRSALRGITGNADQYIQAIRNFYGSSKEGVDKINEVVNFVENLPEQLDVEQMQLNALDKIKSAVDGVGLDVGSILQPSLNKLVEAYKTANKLDAGLYKDALISALDTYGTGILNSAASKDENKQRAAAQIVDSGLSATMGIANSNIAEPDKTAALNALNEATKAAGQFTAAYALMPDETNLALMKQAVTDFTSLISKSAETIGDKNFATVFISALGGFTTALSNSTLSLDVMGSVASGINKAVSAWALAAKLGTEESKTLAAGVIAYGAYLSKTATNYRIDGEQKKEIYAQMSGAALTLFTNVSTNIGKEKLKGYTQDFVDVLIGKGKTDKASAMGATGVIETISALLGSQATTYAQRKPLIDKLLDGSEKFVTGYRDLIAKAGETADVKNAMLYLSNGSDEYLKNTAGILDDLAGSTANAEAYLTSGYEKYIENTVAKLKTSSVTDMTVGITTLNGALNDTIKYAADQVNQAIATAKNKVEEVNRAEAARIAAEEAATTPVQQATKDRFLSDLLTKSSNVETAANVTVGAAYKMLNGESFGYKYREANFSPFAYGSKKDKTVTFSIFAYKDNPDILKKIESEGWRFTGETADHTRNMYKKTLNDLPKFATGGAFTNGIVDRPTNFNMGLMGEAGSEAIMPLANIGGRLGVHAQISANDSNVDMSETVDELKKQNEQLSELVKQTTALLKLQMAANQELVEKMADMSESLKTSAKKTRLQAVA